MLSRARDTASAALLTAAVGLATFVGASQLTPNKGVLFGLTLDVGNVRVSVETKALYVDSE